MEKLSLRYEGTRTLTVNGQTTSTHQVLERTYDAREIAAEWYGGLMLVVAVLVILLLREAIQHLRGR